MQTTYVMAAFAFPNGDAHNDFEILYGGFKQYYMKQSRSSDERELAFVFCVRANAVNLDILSSRVETDVYFCRKFVVRLFLPLNKSLARLPFLPLTPMGAASMRPPSAQTFLQNCGLSATLAKFLVVARERSAERIVKDSLSGALGEPVQLTSTANDALAIVERTAKRTRLESIEIEDFRAYRKPQTFSLGADVTVLFGPNGFGKTSLFDAIDFAVTGDIGRMSIINEAHFKKIATHLDGSTKDSVVKIAYSSNGDVHTIERGVDSRKHAKLNGRATDRKTILAELTDSDFSSADRVENFVSLFRATHLFSQEHQELMKDFHPRCELSENIVSRLLAFEDYTTAANKTARVREILRSEIRDAEKKLRELSEQIRSDSEEIDRLGSTVVTDGGVDELDGAVEALRGEMTRAGVPADPEGPRLDVVRRWRAAIEVRHATTQAEIDRLTALSNDAAEGTTVVAEVSRIRKLLEESETVLDEVRKRHSGAVEQLRQAESRHKEISTKRGAAVERAEILGWLQANHGKYVALLKGERELAEGISLVGSGLAECQKRAEVLARELKATEGTTGRLEQELATKLARHRDLDELRGTATNWHIWKSRLVDLEDAERKTTQSLDVLEGQEREVSVRREAVLATEARLAEQVAEMEDGQSEVRRLLLELKGRIQSGMCLLCGEDHGSKEELLRRVDEQLEADAATVVRMELTEARTRAKSLAGTLAAFREQRTGVERELERLHEEREKLMVAVGNFEDAAGKAGIAVDGFAVAQIQEECDSARVDVTRITQEIGELRKKEETIQATSLAVREEIAQTVATRRDLEAEIATNQGELQRLREDWRAARISLDIDSERLAELERANSADAIGLSAELERTDTTVMQAKARVLALQQELETREIEVGRLGGQINKFANTMTRIVARLEDSNLGGDVDEQTVLSFVAAESRAQAEFIRLRDRAVRLEQAIDRATTAAALAQARKNVQEKQAVVTQVNQRVKLCGTWVKFFDSIAELISSQRKRATDDFTREYGPRTSVIQQRLRSVYGFEEVEISSHESTIRVRVRRREDELRPTDYFSQSQQQTLLLGLFLTTCISQTWSSLSVVLLDDPVTHFDNLNCYSFLDLIAGLVDSESEGHQFILSTCDEKFFQLARQRFKHLQDGATFYMFSAIDEDGPVVEVIPGHESTSNHA